MGSGFGIFGVRMMACRLVEFESLMFVDDDG
jgi:hypothetical protein